MIDLKKKYQTRDGREVVALFHYPENSVMSRIIAHINERGRVFTACLSEDGGCFFDGTPCRSDLIPITTKVTRWFNVYHHRNGFYLGEPFDSEEEAKVRAPTQNYIKTISIEVEID